MAKKKIEYGMLAAKIATLDTDATVTKETFFHIMEEKYPSHDGWEVYSTESTLVRTPFNGIETELPYVTYHLKKVNI